MLYIREGNIGLWIFINEWELNSSYKYLWYIIKCRLPQGNVCYLKKTHRNRCIQYVYSESWLNLGLSMMVICTYSYLIFRLLISLNSEIIVSSLQNKYTNGAFPTHELVSYIFSHCGSVAKITQIPLFR